MRNQRGSTVLVLIVFLAIFFFFLLYISSAGWGYAGYRRSGSHYTPYPPAFWYFGGPSYYSGPSVRSGSVGGPGHLGGGPRAGK